MWDKLNLAMWQQFFENGGPLILILLMVGFVLWFLIIERYYFLNVEYPALQKKQIAQWQERSDKCSWNAHKIREMHISDNEYTLQRSLSLIKVLIAICPLLGLLGTVTGMLGVFEIISLTGSSDAKAMGAGIYKATIPTMVGLFLALSALYFSHALQSKARHKSGAFSDQLKIFTPTTKGLTI